jgi:hypothetical protein
MSRYAAWVACNARDVYEVMFKTLLANMLHPNSRVPRGAGSFNPPPSHPQVQDAASSAVATLVESPAMEFLPFAPLIVQTITSASQLYKVPPPPPRKSP